ncbi:NmrA family NAD(P)-binding protein [Nakamurella leprariae]|uniref:NmrA family NAD(P)-binding protein n=1 Tax=Nakamurella leprariae TaxID=2803911 RepID=A0A938YHJ4_9ACTN|nr:NmrA family NAD(P)-binding protein [Nakamurella leprariae]MBM9468254.1 NmrA family NAD(P)-binding protein [Nakamurella leprariae]
MVVLVIGATGMFGSRVTAQLVAHGVPVRALVRDEARARTELGSGPELVVGDLDRPDTVDPAVRGADTVFLVTPMDTRIADRELAVIAKSERAGVRRVVKVHGAVRHDGDELEQLHQRSIAALRASGLDWVTVSPNSVMETSLFGQAGAIAGTGSMWGCADQGRVGLVAADDVGRAAAAVLTDERPLEPGTDFVITGPEALTMTQVAAVMSDVLGRSVTYQDLPLEKFRQILLSQGLSEQDAEIGVISHFRAWRRGGADIVTDTYRRLTGSEPTSLRQWLAAHRADFAWERPEQ